LPIWGGRVFAEIRRSDIAELLDHIEDQHGPHQADAVLGVLRNAGHWLRDRSDDYASPFVGIKSRVAHQHRKRDRVLSDHEIKAIWAACPTVGSFGALTQLLLLTAQRFDKCRTMRHPDISAEGVWTIRTEEREKGNAGVLRLPKLALDIIAARPRLAGNDHVFPGKGRGHRRFEHPYKVALDKLSGTGGWRVHDLRRTARSLLSRAGVRPDIAEKVLGHAVGNIESVYDRHSYEDEKADALSRLAALVECIVNPPSDNVVPMYEAAASS
jgi:integrase